jgi:hypothetical protein
MIQTLDEVVQQRSCTICMRRQLHVAANIMRCSEKRSRAADGVIWLDFSKTRNDIAHEQAYQGHARAVASRCRFFQQEPA